MAIKLRDSMVEFEIANGKGAATFGLLAHTNQKLKFEIIYEGRHLEIEGSSVTVTVVDL
jgi:hypothetical protein